MNMEDQRVIEIAKMLYRNKASVCRSDLEVVSQGNKDLYDDEAILLSMALKRIVKDGYDVTGFYLDDSPVDGWFSLYDGENRYFDIVVKEEGTFIEYPYPISGKSTVSKQIKVNRIAEAIAGSHLWLENCKLAL